MTKNKVLLLILDGWGVGSTWGGNAISIANTPNYNKILRSYSNTKILASGNSVGLPGHEVGNSEVGHMNLGAGRVVSQDILLINKSIESGEFYNNEQLKRAISQSKQKKSTVHLMGIVSDGGIHSHIIHLFALLKLCQNIGHKDVQIHAFTDGRDTEDMKGMEFLNKLSFLIKRLGTGEIATIVGRVFLDRKGYWPRTKTIYEALVNGTGRQEKNALSALSSAYKRGETDEYISPIILNDKRIKDGDTVVFFNFRSDRTRQLVSAFLDPKFNKFKREQLNDLDFITFIPYGIEKELGVEAKSAFPSIEIENTIGKYFEEMGMKQFHIAETEKFAHVTFFINGNRNDPYSGEERILIPSPDVKSYAEKPEMSADEVKSVLIKQLKSEKFNLYICNLANGDMVGHTGNFPAAVKAVEALDVVIKEIADVCANRQIPLIITADHGNIEQMVDPMTGEPHNEHTKNPVPLIIASPHKYILKEGGRLANIAHTCLQVAGIEKPEYFNDGMIEQIIDS